MTAMEKLGLDEELGGSKNEESRQKEIIFFVRIAVGVLTRRIIARTNLNSLVYSIRFYSIR